VFSIGEFILFNFIVHHLLLFATYFFHFLLFNCDKRKGVESKTEISYAKDTMPITLEQIVEETRHWPPEKVGELVGRLTEDLRLADPETEAAWQTEISRRVEEIQTGKVQGIPVEESLDSIRKIAGL
jgi:putative addiction module component (TIGR02574 family)